MIKEVDGSIFDNLPPYSVIVHQCNAKGQMPAGIAKEIRLKWPKVYNEYREYCLWFKDGHEDEILGSVAAVKVNDKLIICNAIAQITVSRAQQVTDYDAWDKICEKLERQTRYNNKITGQNWTIHIPYKIGCGLGGGDLEKMHEIFFKYFNQSPVELVYHRY